MKKIIILRGNSGSGKTTVARVHIPQELRIRSRGTERHSASD